MTFGFVAMFLCGAAAFFALFDHLLMYSAHTDFEPTWGPWPPKRKRRRVLQTRSHRDLALLECGSLAAVLAFVTLRVILGLPADVMTAVLGSFLVGNLTRTGIQWWFPEMARQPDRFYAITGTVFSVALAVAVVAIPSGA